MPYIPDDPILHSRQRAKPVATAPATFGEFAGAAAEAFLATERSVSRPLLQQDVHEEVMDAYRSVTGKAFRWRNERGYLTDGAPAFDRGAERFWRAMDEEVKANPELREALPFADLIGARSRMAEIAQNADRQRQEVGARASGVAVLGGFAGDLAAMATDPPVAASFFLGAPMAARTTLLKGAAIEAAIAGTTEAGVQVFAQQFREEVGLEAGLDRAIRNVGTAALGASGIYAAGALLARGLRGLRQQTAVDQVVKEQHLADNAPPPDLVPPAEHRRRVDQAIFDIEEGRAINVDQAPDLTARTDLVDLETIGRRLQSIERQGVPINDLVPNLGRAMAAVSDGARIVMSRQRVDGLAARAANARREVRPLYEAAADAERAVQDVLQQQSDNTTAQIANELARGGRRNAERVLDRATRQRLADIESRLQRATDADVKASLNAERRKIVDAARKRVEREGGRLEAEAERLRVELISAQTRRSEADVALQRAEREITEAESAIARQIGGALTDRDVRRLYEQRQQGVVDAGEMPPGQSARIAQATRAEQTVIEETEGPAAELIRDAQNTNGQDIAAELGDDVFVNIDGEDIPASQVYARIAEDEADAAELEVCIRGG